MNKTKFICYLVASICYYGVSALKFFDKNVLSGILYLGLGSAFLCLAIASKKEK